MTSQSLASTSLIRTKPTTAQVLVALLRADALVTWRQRKSVIMSFVLPLVFLISWKGVIAVAGGAFVLASCISVGLVGLGVLVYPSLIARDRERAVFQRLRAAPIPAWTIMVSRLLVQIVAIWIMTCVVLLAGFLLYKVPLDVGSIALTLLTSTLAGCIFLAMGQAVVGLIVQADTVNAVARLVSLPLIVVGGLGETGFLGDFIQGAVKWSPFGIAKALITFGVSNTTATSDLGVVLLFTVGYTVIFALVGIRWFRWATN